MDKALLTPLNQLETSLNSLLASLTTTNSFTNAPNATQTLLSADDNLTSALTTLKEHQANYARILTLRAEADRLQTQLRDIVRTCVDLRSEIADIHPSILDETDTDDEDEVDPQNQMDTARSPVKSHGTSNGIHKKQNNPVDYTTVLSFAARIGKHNAAAAIEAERQSNQRSTPGTTQKSQSLSQSQTQTTQPGTNGDNTQTQTQTQTQTTDLTIETNNTTEESLAELAAINDTLATQRAARGMAFPLGEALRLGALGKLQYIREQEGEAGVDREVERLVRESEGHRIIMKESSREAEEEEVLGTTNIKQNLPARPSLGTGTQQQQVPRPQPLAATQVQQQQPPSLPLPPKPKIALDLDFPDSDDDDDDD